MIQFDKSTLTYTPLFCEENIWKLVESLIAHKQANPIDVLFIINKNKSVAIFEQKKSIANQPVIWDYHVILSAQINTKIVIFDFDSRNNFPTEIKEYFNNTFPTSINLETTIRPNIRYISAVYFLKHFYSDRSHMLNLIPQDEFPEYSIIQPENDIQHLTLDNCRSSNYPVPQSQVLTPEEYLLFCLTSDHKL